MVDPETIFQQRRLLAAHRRTLSHYLVQRAQLGTAYVPPMVSHGIDDARREIQRIKEQLRERGVAVEDMPDDMEVDHATVDDRVQFNSQHSEEKRETPTFILYLLSLPFALLYFALLYYFNQNLISVIVGYIFIGVAFGIIQTRLRFKQPYHTSFFSSALVPTLVFLALAGLNELNEKGLVVDLSKGIIVSSEPVYVVRDPYISAFGIVAGSVVYVITLTCIVLPCGVFGIIGRVIGENVRFRQRAVKQLQLRRDYSKQLNVKQTALKLLVVNAVGYIGIVAVLVLKFGYR